MATDDKPPAAGGGSFLTRKIGPAPAWVYGVAAAVGAFLWIRHTTGGSADTPDSSGTSSADDTTDDDADDIAQETADDLEDDQDDFTPPPDTTNVPTPPDVTSTTGSGTPAPKGNTSAKLRVVSVTKADDTVPKFLAKYGVSLAQLRKDNPHRTWKATEKLKPGDKIHVPSKG